MLKIKNAIREFRKGNKALIGFVSATGVETIEEVLKIIPATNCEGKCTAFLRKNGTPIAVVRDIDLEKDRCRSIVPDGEVFTKQLVYFPPELT